MKKNNSNTRKKDNREKKDLSADIKVRKQQKAKRKADAVDMSIGIIDIDNTPDVATWNKKIHVKDDTARVIANRFHDAEEIQTPPTIGIGLRDRKAPKKDLSVDPANRREVEDAIEFGSILTDEATDLYQ
jgi:hypothetical protein